MQQLDQVITDARPVPLTDQLRIDKDQAYDILDRIRAEMGSGAPPDGSLLIAVDELDDAIHNARPVPLTDQVRLERGQLEGLIGKLRDAILRGNRH
jgi:hypothetical protein